jgi:hypothetical protein
MLACLRMTSSAWRLHLSNLQVIPDGRLPGHHRIHDSHLCHPRTSRSSTPEPQANLIPGFSACHAAVPLVLVRPSLVCMARPRAAASRGSPSSLAWMSIDRVVTPDYVQYLMQACQCTSGTRGTLTGLACVPLHYYGASRRPSGKSRCASVMRAQHILRCRQAPCMHP